MGQEKIWDYFQNDKVEVFEGSLPRLLFLCKKIKKGQKVLNIGIGNGCFERLSQQLGVDIHSLDPNKKSIEAVKKKLGLFEKAKVGFLQDIPFEDYFFDAVVVSEVLEHTSHEVLYSSLLEIQRILKKSGRLLITVPYNEILTDNIAICPNCESVFHRWGHEQSFTRKSLQNVLEKVGFKIKKNDIRCFPNWSRKGVKNLIKSCSRYVLGRFGAGIAQPNIFILAEITKPLQEKEKA